jgi:predicted kinase
MDFGLDMEEEEHNTRHDLIEAMLWDVAERVLILGVDVILDFGFWGRSEREDYRSRAARLGASSQVHFLNVPTEVLMARLAARNAQLPPGTFLIPEEKLRAWILQFQSPSQDELEPREAQGGARF